MSIEYLPLRLNANCTVKGPHITYSESKLVVEYDYEHDDGAVEWSNVEFEEVLYWHYCESICCTADSVLSRNVVRRDDESERYSIIMAFWWKSVGSHDYQKKLGGPARFSRYTVYFDDAGAVEVIASNCRIE